MKKQLLAVLLPLLLTGCAAAQPDEQVNAPAETTVQTEAVTTEPDTEPDTEAATEPETVAPTEQAAYTGESHIYDECGVLDAAVLSHYNEYLDDLAAARMLCTAVVITDRLNGEKPEVYAKRYYQNLFGTKSGFLLLINNDTLKDVFYREGVCSTYITDTALPITQATPHLVEGDYAGALDILLPLGELVPDHIFDRSGSLKNEQVQTLLETAQTLPERNCVLLTTEVPQPTEGQTAEEALAAYAESLRSRQNAKTMLVADVQNKRCVIAGAPPELLALEVQEIWAAQGLFAALQDYYAGL